MSYPYANSAQAPPAAPYAPQYHYQQNPYGQHPAYHQGYPPNPTAYGYQYYPQPHTSPYASTSKQTPSHTLSLSTPTTSSTPPQQAPPPTSNHATSGAAARAPKKPQSLKGTFNKELRSMMYAFGDAKEPANDTVDVMEEILMEYLVDVSNTALAPSRKTRIQIEDLRRALGRHADSKKLARLEELLFMQDDIRRARKQFNTEENELALEAHP